MHREQARRALDQLAAFTVTPLDEVLDRHHREDPRDAAVALFHEVTAQVPAYPWFLAEHGVDPAGVRTFADFERVPPVTKASYVSKHPLAQLCRGGRLSACDMVAVSSGSTGSPTFWPRTLADELAIASRFEQVFRDSFAAHEKSTLAVVCFALGTWVGGMFTTACCRHLATKGYPVTVITPGNNKEEILRVVGELGPSFDQVVLLGYPPFVKDVVDAGLARGVDWGRLHTRVVTAGEVFSEAWRTLVAERIGSTAPAYDFASLYGTADAGVLGNETPLSIAIRRFLAARPEAARAVFGQDRLPTLVQYDPLSRFFEETDGGGAGAAGGRTLLFSGDNVVPLVRYGILDTGGVVPYEAMMTRLAGLGFDPLPLLARGGARMLPFVYVFGRSDFTVSFYGANVFPENVTVGLEQPAVAAWVTGKFVMEVQADADHHDAPDALFIVVELAPGEAASEARREAAASSIEEHLCRLNSEFQGYVPAARRTPRVTLVPTGDPSWFPVGVKHRYTRRPG